MAPQWRDWVLSEDQSRHIAKRILEWGINFFDTDDMYSLRVSEEVLGRALEDSAQRIRCDHSGQGVLAHQWWSE